jgi:putative transposase
MPSRHLEKLYAEDSYYHVFNRGVEKRKIFLEDSDFLFFLSLLERYIGPIQTKDAKYRLLPNYYNDVELLAYCLMPNHIHMFLYQHDRDAIQQFMRSLFTSYSMYFNRKYNRVGGLFQDRYKAVPIHDDSYFTHISRYIHLNPLDIKRDYKTYPYSSLQGWIGKDKPSWLRPDRAMTEFLSANEYLYFLADYRKVKAELDTIKKELKE